MLTGLLAGTLAVADVAERQKFRKALATGDKVSVCRQAVRSEDSAVRRWALASLYEADAEKGLIMAEKLIKDKAGEVRELAARILGRHPNDARKAILQKLSKSDPVDQVRYSANHALWPLYRQNVLLKDDPSWDYLVKLVKTDNLPQDNWKIAADKNADGHLKGFNKIDFDDSSWKSGKVNDPANCAQGGVVWYRLKYKADAPDKQNSYEIVLPEVKGNCYIWLNGVYLGQRTDGKSGELRMNGGKEVKPNAENVLVIRVDAPKNGGITTPVKCDWME